MFDPEGLESTIGNFFYYSGDEAASMAKGAWNLVSSQGYRNKVGDAIFIQGGKDYEMDGVRGVFNRYNPVATLISGASGVDQVDGTEVDTVERGRRVVNGFFGTVQIGLAPIALTRNFGLTNTFRNVELIDAAGTPVGEFDEVHGGYKFVEEKSARGLAQGNPRTGLPSQTAAQWAEKQIFDKTSKRIEALEKLATDSRPVLSTGSSSALSLQALKKIKRFEFKIESSAADVKRAVETQTQRLSKQYPDYSFSAKYGN